MTPSSGKPKRTLAPHPVERRIVEVVQEGQELSDEQRTRVAAWLEANGIEPRRVALNTITVECNVHGSRESRHVIGFHEYYETPDGQRTINERTLDAALTFQRWVAQTVPLEPDPMWEGWDAYDERIGKLKSQPEPQQAGAEA
jgi:hypothetical protein